MAMGYLKVVTPESLYIHIPFCLGKCRYCDFVSIRYDEAVAGRYIDALRTELRMRANGSLKTLYIGGGTPTVLPAKSLRKIVSSVLEFCTLAPGAEVTCEANPGTLDKEKAEALAEAGLTRLSIGVQSFDNEVLKTLGRAHDADDARHALGIAQEMPVDVSLDLIYGVPGQSMETWRETLDEAVSMGPAHISAYELTPEEGTPLMDDIKAGEISMPHEEEALEMFHAAREILGKAGMEHYEISNYARPGKRSLHNMNYWRRGEYLGVGTAAHSLIGEERTANNRFVFEYLKLLGEGMLPIEETSELTADEARREYVFLGLRMLEGLHMQEARERFGLDLNGSTGELVDNGLMEQKAGRLRLSQRGLELSNTTVSNLLEALGL